MSEIIKQKSRHFNKAASQGLREFYIRLGKGKFSKVTDDSEATFLSVKVDQTPEMEREKFLKFKETFKLDEDPAGRTANYKKREYSVSKVFTKWVIFSPIRLDI